jgi:SAM-dependent methyltransferase
MPEKVPSVLASSVTDRPTPATVRMAYLLILGREPESEMAVAHALDYDTVAQMRAAFLASEEFRSHAGRLFAAVGLPAQPLDAPPLEVEWLADAPTAATLLAHVQRTWTRLGIESPHWSVLSAEEFRPELVAKNEERFFASGGTDAAQLVAILTRHGVAPTTHPHVLEFGCGIGRVTPFLGRHFTRVTALDVSETHMTMARAMVDHVGLRNVTFRIADVADFAMAEPFDIWFSRIVLQHNPPPIMAMILQRALSCLAPGGLAVFQVPTYAARYRFEIADYLAGMHLSDGIEMHVLPQPVVFRLAAEAGCRPLELIQDQSVGGGWISHTFVLCKDGGSGNT